MHPIPATSHDQLLTAMHQVMAAHDTLSRAASELQPATIDPCAADPSADLVDAALVLAITRGADNLSALAGTLAAAAVSRDSSNPLADVAADVG